ncbi:Phosphoglycolate phosphatase, HAD superfamily [Melghirimyces thermohalophilus]|uniref:Phosphoglycolate phosphatase, HAD superfamily n=1 Tax=Melghirimyces thermohalophilus TaxID=1236220 RepID=A0A1G6PAT7_9BACL|nr:HAD hydrolase-like protein [Melghirimyces thermohalophilus]SDC77189.1 Phosphoglycolate phosphatase, HAD superfamily [Melghirimyces thermohalophilus]
MNNHKNDKGDTIIFDLDGTLFQTETVAVPAFYRMYQRLEGQGMYWGSPPAKSRIESVFGMIAPDIWEQLLPGASEEVKQAADEGWLQEELSCLSEGLGALYPGVSRGLRELKRREWRLFIASNGLGPYVRGVVETFGLTPLFTGIYSAGEYQIGDKAELVKRLMQENEVSSACMVGDRSSDIRAGQKNGLFTIGCCYADFPRFSTGGELEGADAVIDAFDRFPDLVGNPRL